MNMYDALRKELEKQIPEIAEQYISNVESFINILKSTYGEELKIERPKGTSIFSSFKGLNDMWITYKQWDNHSSKFNEYRARGYVRDCPFVFDKDAVMPHALDYAKDAVRKWEMKIMEKLGDLEEIKVPYHTDCGFIVCGKRNGQDVAISQQMILNVRYETYTFFNQFPARIYVDGKSMSASAYKKHFNN